MQQKKIAIVANTAWYIYNFRMNLVRVLLERGCELIIITPDENTCYRVDIPGVRYIPLKKLHRRSTNPWQDLLLVIEFYRIYKKERPDLTLHFTVKPNIFGGFSAGMLGLPSIAVIAGLGYAFIHKGPVQEIAKLLYRISALFHGKLIFENQDDLELFTRLKIIKAQQGIFVKGSGVDSDHFKPYSLAKQQTGTVFTYIGRLLYDKGIREYVEAARMISLKYPETAFWMVGDLDTDNPASVRQADLNQWIEDKIIIYHGHKIDVREFVSQSSCIVLPSYREGLPKVILEAMSMAKPVIVSDAPGCREAVTHLENGFLVKPQSAGSLADAMEKFIHLKEDERNEMGRNGRSKILDFFEDRIIANQLADIIEKELHRS